MRKRLLAPALALAALFASTASAQEQAATPLSAAQQQSDSQQAAPQQQATPQTEVALGNKEVLDLLAAGMSPAIITAKVKAASSKFDTSPAALQALKAAGATDEVILAVIEAAAPKMGEAPKRRVTDELTTKFRELQSTVVTVFSETGSGTGFIFDPRGLVMTNQHVIDTSELVSVQFDERTKVGARVLASDPQRDVAVLWVDLSALPGAAAAKIARSTADEPQTVVEGERVMTIGSPLNQRKIMTTGIASKVEAHAIISDININHGNSGGPLFNSVGEVVGITTFGDFTRQGGPGVSGIIKIEETGPVVELAVGKMGLVDKPEGRLLPVDPTDKYPLDAIKEVAEAKKFDFDPYTFNEADFAVALITPPVRYRLETEAAREAAKTKNKRNNSKDAVQGTFSFADRFHNWAEYVGDYKPVLIIQAQPVLGESFWGGFGRAMAASQGIRAQANLRFKTDFYRMKLYCGTKEVEPILPGKSFQMTNENNYDVRSKDATFTGVYFYPADAINETCGTAYLEIFSEKHPEKAERHDLGKKTIERIISDFKPYFAAKGAGR
jgi:S1-C subfamily serine protease